jgi:long-chain acyl-CoA synthetase
MALTIHTALPNSGDLILGRTLADLLDDAVARYPNPRAINQPRPDGGWTTLSTEELRRAAEEAAAGLLDHGIASGDRAAFLLNSDYSFTLADFACVLSGVISAPLYVTFSRENLVYVTRHSEARVMFVSNPDMLASFAEWAGDVPGVQLVVVHEGDPGATHVPATMRVVTMDALRAAGRAQLDADADLAPRMRRSLDPSGLATLIYTSGTTGQPKGVMLSHENITSNAYATLTYLGVLGHQEEVALTFLPMTHVFARMLQFAHVAWGHSLYYSDPDRLVGHLAEVRPTVFATVPRVLEKVYDKVSLGIMQGHGLKKVIGSWALGLAQGYTTGEPRSGLSFALADRLVYSKLREKLGLTRAKAVGVGGAALRADLCNVFNAFGIPAVQGYGLTETSPVISINTPTRNRAGTVGMPVPGVEVAIADDGEILSRGPHIMMGYYKDEAATAEVMDQEGWFHTGDIGDFTDEGYLRITDRKKALFKLSTGKYVIPQPIENRLMESALIDQAVVLGSGHQFCAALIFPGMEAVRVWASVNDVPEGLDDSDLLAHPKVKAEFDRLVEEANGGMDHWSQVKRYHLIPEAMTVENELLTPTMKVKRAKVREAFAADIEGLYAATRPEPVA